LKSSSGSADEVSGLEMNKEDAPYEGETGTEVGHLEDKKGPR